jgi:hypothetical protein
LKKWEAYLVLGVILLVVGGLLFAIPNTLAMPYPYKTFLGIPYEISEEYVSEFVNRLRMEVVGVLLIGVGFGVLLCVADIRKLEKIHS